MNEQVTAGSFAKAESTTSGTAAAALFRDRETPSQQALELFDAVTEHRRLSPMLNDDERELAREYFDDGARAALAAADDRLALVPTLVSALRNLSGWMDLAEDLPADKAALFAADLQAARDALARALPHTTK